jgi:hypothetical protein
MKKIYNSPTLEITEVACLSNLCEMSGEKATGGMGGLFGGAPKRRTTPF